MSPARLFGSPLRENCFSSKLDLLEPFFFPSSMLLLSLSKGTPFSRGILEDVLRESLTPFCKQSSESQDAPFPKPGAGLSALGRDPFSRSTL